MRTEDQDHYQQAETEHVFIVGVDQTGELRLGNPQDQPAEHRARQRTNTAEYRCGKGLDADDEPGEKVEGAVVHGDQYAGQCRHGCTDDEYVRNDPISVDTQDRGHLAILLRGAAHAAQLGVLDDVGQHAHANERGNQDEDLGVGDLHETTADVETHGAFEQGWNALLAWALGDLRVVLQDQRNTDGTDQRCQTGRITQRSVSHALDDEAVHTSHHDGEDQRAENQERERFDTEERQHGQADCCEIGGDHIHVAVGEVDHADDAVDHRVTDGDQAVDRTKGQAVDHLLQENTIHHARSRT